jgi:hypothetical protein
MQEGSKKTGIKKINRRYFIGGSDARIIMGSDEQALVRLWREKRGEIEPDDLSGNLVVQLGLATEELNRRWYEANTGQVITDIQKQVRHPALRWMAATLDGRIEASDAVFEAKFMLPWLLSEEAAADQTAQLGSSAMSRRGLFQGYQFEPHLFQRFGLMGGMGTGAGKSRELQEQETAVGRESAADRSQLTSTIRTVKSRPLKKMVPARHLWGAGLR